MDVNSLVNRVCLLLRPADIIRDCLECRKLATRTVRIGAAAATTVHSREGRFGFGFGWFYNFICECTCFCSYSQRGRVQLTNMLVNSWIRSLGDLLVLNVNTSVSYFYFIVSSFLFCCSHQLTFLLLTPDFLIIFLYFVVCCFVFLFFNSTVVSTSSSRNRVTNYTRCCVVPSAASWRFVNFFWYIQLASSVSLLYMITKITVWSRYFWVFTQKRQRKSFIYYNSLNLKA